MLAHWKACLASLLPFKWVGLMACPASLKPVSSHPSHTPWPQRNPSPRRAPHCTFLVTRLSQVQRPLSSSLEHPPFSRPSPQLTALLLVSLWKRSPQRRISPGRHPQPFCLPALEPAVSPWSQDQALHCALRPASCHCAQGHLLCSCDSLLRELPAHPHQQAVCHQIFMPSLGALSCPLHPSSCHPLAVLSL